MQVVICICSGCVPNQIQPTLSPPCTLVFLKWSEQMWTAVIMDKKLFSQFMWKSMFLFCPVVLEQRCEFFPITMHQVITSEGQSFFKRTVSQIYFRSQLHSLVKCERTRCSKGFCYREYLVWNAATASLSWNSLVCPASDQVSIPKSGFQIASPPLFFFIIFLHVFWGWGILCLYWVQ